MPRRAHSVVPVGSCLIVAGGYTVGSKSPRSVEVLDTIGNTVWELPKLSVRNLGETMV